MADKEPNQNNNYYLVGGPLIVNTRNKSIDMPPKKSKNCIDATKALNDGVWMTIKADDNEVIRNKNGVIVTRRDGKGNVLTSKQDRYVKSTKASSNKPVRGQQISSYDRG